MTDATPATPGPRRLLALAVAVVAVVAVAVAAATAFGGPARQVETGIVVAVEATSLSSVQGFSIRTVDGRTVDFRVGSIENAATFPPGHLSEHKVSLAPIRVTFVDRDGAHVAVRIEDAP
ncbi:MAG TPA: hypothetical protein VHM48_07110 [Candidatus Limnocylindrales bacterium]|nr:hypothetical protein [Candidatus Limnocylindrales bacterium]